MYNAAEWKTHSEISFKNNFWWKNSFLLKFNYEDNYSLYNNKAFNLQDFYSSANKNAPFLTWILSQFIINKNLFPEIQKLNLLLLSTKATQMNEKTPISVTTFFSKSFVHLYLNQLTTSIQKENLFMTVNLNLRGLLHLQILFCKVLKAYSVIMITLKNHCLWWYSHWLRSIGLKSHQILPTAL